jgi:hypothetical protein
MALPGRWATMTAPTTMNAVKASSRAMLRPGSRWKLPLSTDRVTVTTKQTTKIASMDQASQVERLRKVPPRLLRGTSLTACRLRGDRPEIVTGFVATQRCLCKRILHVSNTSATDHLDQ